MHRQLQVHPVTATALPRPDRRVAKCQFGLAHGYTEVPNQLGEVRGRGGLNHLSRVYWEDCREGGGEDTTMGKGGDDSAALL